MGNSRPFTEKTLKSPIEMAAAPDRVTLPFTWMMAFPGMEIFEKGLKTTFPFRINPSTIVGVAEKTIDESRNDCVHAF